MCTPEFYKMIKLLHSWAVIQSWQIITDVINTKFDYGLSQLNWSAICSNLWLQSTAFSNKLLISDETPGRHCHSRKRDFVSYSFAYPSRETNLYYSENSFGISTDQWWTCDLCIHFCWLVEQGHHRLRRVTYGLLENLWHGIRCFGSVDPKGRPKLVS